MKLSDKFQFRIEEYPGFTHTSSKNGHGYYEVKWARGYPNKIREIPRVVFDECDVRGLVEMGAWIVADEPPKQNELPGEFVATNTYSGGHWKMRKIGEIWFAFDFDSGLSLSDMHYTEKGIKKYLNDGIWTIQTKRVLTAEQQRQLNDFKERVAQLEQAIKLNEQSIEHYKRLVANYEATKADLLKKIEEMA